MIGVRILGTGSAHPQRAVSTEELVALAQTSRTPAEVIAKTGIRNRYWQRPGERPSDLGVAALRAALDDAGLAATAIETLIYISSTGGDWLVPATANRVAQQVGTRRGCAAFDLNNACTGFLSAFDLAARGIATGKGITALVSASTTSDTVRPEDPRPYLVFGDAAGVVLLGPSDTPGQGMLASDLGNDADLFNALVLAHPRTERQMTFMDFGLSNREMVQGTIERVRTSVQSVLDEAQVRIEDVDWVLPHQPNGRFFAALVEALGVDPARTLPVVQDVGATSNASIPYSLDKLRSTHGIEHGQLVLMTAIGAGVSYGSILVRF